ncbi:MAG: energy transducer TonB [Myxococcota bacterium]
MAGPPHRPKRERFEADSIAGLVFDPAASVAPAPPRLSRIHPGSIAATVFAHASSSPSVRRLLAGAFIVATIGGAAAWSAASASRGAPARGPVEESEPMRIEQLVELAPPEPAEPVEAPKPKAERRVATRKPLAKPDAPGAKPPPPAQAGKLVATAPDDPLDFTEASFVSADAPQFAGGVTAPSGTNTEAVRTSTVDPNARPGGPQGEGSLARPVRLPARNWHCPWPEEAEMLGITEQTVVLRVMVDASGVSKRVSVLVDPGHGFGVAAEACAKAVRFEPACDEAGVAYSSTSPPIRVRFTR